jgi:hypothetical protein
VNIANNEVNMAKQFNLQNKQINYTPRTITLCCYRHNSTGPGGGPKATWAGRSHRDRLNRPLRKERKSLNGRVSNRISLNIVS